MGWFRGGGGHGVRTLPEKSQKYRLSGQDPLKNHKATKLAFNVGPSSGCQPNTIWMAFHWRAFDGPLKVIFGSSHQLKKQRQSWTPSDKTSGSAHVQPSQTRVLCRPKFCPKLGARKVKHFLWLFSFRIPANRYFWQTMKTRDTALDVEKSGISKLACLR